MFLYSLSLNADDLSVARKHLAIKLPHVKRSHLAEAVAASLGFNTSIALQTVVRSNPVNERRYERFNADAFFNRLVLLGYTVEQRERVPFIDFRFPKTVALDFMVVSQGVLYSAFSELGKSLKTYNKPSREVVDICKQVLSEITVFRKTPGPSSSYNFKHRIEEAFGTYIPNGAVIQAAVELGLKLKMSESLNVQLYVGDKVFKEAIGVALSKVAKVDNKRYYDTILEDIF